MSATLLLKKLAVLASVVMWVALPSMSLAQVRRWTKKANMPTPRCGLSTSVVDGKIYAIGGSPPGGEHLPGAVEEYDPNTDTWRRRADMTVARTGLSTSVVDGKIYAIGGLARASTGVLPTIVEEYDPATDRWRAGADMPTGRGNLSTSVVDGKIYAVGGAYWTGVNNVYSVTEEYDPVTQIWTLRANMLEPRYYLSSGVVDGTVYAIGGLSNAESYLATVEAYDPVTNRWFPTTDVMPTARGMFGMSVVDGKIYAIGGWSGPWPQVTGVVEEYDPTPVPPDFNGDGVVDSRDLSRLNESWGQDDPVVDIAPPPFGDGVIDAQDQELLMSYWGQEVTDPTLIAHWTLDETEGAVAYDAVDENDAEVLGVPNWRPDGGQVDGTLELDGTTSVAANFVLSPADGPFSVLAWVKGGAPGQVIISQTDGADWLKADPIQGGLTTDLKEPSRAGQSLGSQAVITDGGWHRISFVWDGVTRSLYFDDVRVAEDTQQELPESHDGLNIGCGKDLAPESFFAGLIDDVRIYNRAVRP